MLVRHQRLHGSVRMISQSYTYLALSHMHDVEAAMVQWVDELLCASRVPWLFWNWIFMSMHCTCSH